MLLSQSPLSLMINPPSPTSSQATEPNPLFLHGSEAASSFNVCLAEIGETPPSKSRADKKITEALSQGHLLMMKLRMMQ